MNKPAEDPIRGEPKKTPELSHLDVDNIPDDPPMSDQATEVEHMDADQMTHAADLMTHAADLPSPAKGVDDPPSPAKGVDDDVVIMGTGHTSPGHPIALSKHSAKEEKNCSGQG